MITRLYKNYKGSFSCVLGRKNSGMPAAWKLGNDSMSLTQSLTQGIMSEINLLGVYFSSICIIADNV